MCIWGHDHNYERSYPVADSGSSILFSPAGTLTDPFVSQSGHTIHLVLGTTSTAQCLLHIMKY
jgi:hypothetical protein